MNEQIGKSIAKDQAAHPMMQDQEIDAIMKWVGEQDRTYVMNYGRMRYIINYWTMTRNAMPRDENTRMAFNHIQECLTEIMRMRAELDGIAGLAKSAITESPLPV